MDKTLSIYPLENAKLPAFTFRLKTISVCVVLIRIIFPTLWYARSAGSTAQTSALSKVCVVKTPILIQFAYTPTKVRTVKLTDKLEFIA